MATSVGIIIAINVLGLGAIWLYARARLDKALGLDSLMEGLRQEVRALNIELNETADRNISLVEDRMEALRSLLDEADRRLGVMGREIERRATEREVYSRLGRPRPEDRPPQDAAAEKPLAAPMEAQTAPPPATAAFDAPGRGRGGDLPELQSSGSGAADPIRLDLSRRVPEVRQARQSVIPPKPMREEALELYRKGFSAEIIAARLGATVAEIDLLVSLEEGRAGGREDRP